MLKEFLSHLLIAEIHTPPIQWLQLLKFGHYLLKCCFISHFTLEGVFITSRQYIRASTGNQQFVVEVDIILLQFYCFHLFEHNHTWLWAVGLLLLNTAILIPFSLLLRGQQTMAVIPKSGPVVSAGRISSEESSLLRDSSVVRISLTSGTWWSSGL